MQAREPETVVVTGGAGGIGSATVRYFASEGCRVVIGDINIEGARKCADGLERVAAFPLDILEYDSIRDFARSVGEEFGTVAHLVHIAGGALQEEAVETPLDELSVEAISTTIDWNLKSSLYLIREFLPLLKKDKNPNRSVVLISSVNALISFGQAAYSSSKAGMIGIVRAAANELGARGIRINAVLPGSTPTEESKKFLGDIFEELRLGSSLKRLTTPAEVAATIFALTHLMTSVTGQYIVVDSGQAVCYPYRKQ